MSGFQLQETDKVCCIEDVRKYKPYRTADRLSNTNTRRKTCLHICTHRHTQTHTHTKKKTHTKKFLHRSFYTWKFLHTEPFAHRTFYTQTLLHTEAFTQTRLHTNAFTQPFYTQPFLHTNTFAHRHSTGSQKTISCRGHFKIANSQQFLTPEPHFVRKGCRRTNQSRKKPSAFDDRTSFRAKWLPRKRQIRNFTSVFDD